MCIYYRRLGYSSESVLLCIYYICGINNIVAYLWFRSKAWTVQYIPYCTVVSAIYGYCTVVALITTHCLLSPCTCVLSYKPVNTPQAGLYEYNALVRNHKYIQPSGFALVLYVLVVTHSCIILHTAELGVY